jgi:hypothetical protein
MPELAGLSPDGLMGLIEREPAGNAHWMPQAHWHRPHVETVPFRKLHKRLGLTRVSVNCTKQQTGDPPLPVPRILAHYAQDAALCSRS